MTWISATLCQSVSLSRDFKSLRFSVPVWHKPLAGQYYTIRSESPERHIAERHYSIANSANEKGVVEFGVHYIEGGEISPLLHKLQVNESIQIKGPFGTHFTWDSAGSDPALFIVGGSGIVPIISMVRTAKDHQTKRPLTLLASFKSLNHALYLEELKKLANTRFLSMSLCLTQKTSKEAQYNRRIDSGIMREVISKMESLSTGTVYVCGSTSFVTSMITILTNEGISEDQIKSEPFG